MGRRENRRDTRFACRVHITLEKGDRRQELMTEDVSFRGLYLRTDTPPAHRQLVGLRGKLPPDGVEFSAEAMVVHIVEPGNVHGRAPGFGVQFYRFSGSAQDTWHRFIEHVQEEHAGDVVPVVKAQKRGLEPINRKHERFETELEVQLRGLGEMQTLKSRDISEGGMFIKAQNLKLEPSTPIQLQLVHPSSKEIVELEGMVRRQSDAPGAAGIGVEFINLDGRKKKSLVDLIQAEVAAEMKAEFVDPDDPDLA